MDLTTFGWQNFAIVGSYHIVLPKEILVNVNFENGIRCYLPFVWDIRIHLYMYLLVYFNAFSQKKNQLNFYLQKLLI